MSVGSACGDFFPIEKSEVTPAKVSVLILIKLYCKYDSEPTVDVIAYRQELGFLIIDQIQSASRHVETTLEDLCYKILKFLERGPETVDYLKRILRSLELPHQLDDFFESMKDLVVCEMDSEDNEGKGMTGKVISNSMFAIFVRTMALNYQSLPFCQAMELFSLLQSYHMGGSVNSVDSGSSGEAGGYSTCCFRG